MFLAIFIRLRVTAFGLTSIAALVASLVMSGCLALCQQPSASRAPWPDPLVTETGKPISSAQEFNAIRRPELLRAFAEDVYGRTPSQTLPVAAHVTSVDNVALNGAAIRKQITLTVGTAPLTRDLHLLLYLPAKAKGPVPVFVGLNFNGNQTVSRDPGIDLNPIWIPDPALDTVHLAKEQEGHILVKPGEATRGADASQWPVETIVKAGYGVATIYAGEIEPDFAAGVGYGIRPLFFKPGQALPEADEWGAIGAWAWGMSRVVDYLVTDAAIDPHAIIATGHSRMGKAVLWSVAQDQRYAMVISNESGQGGASLSHREAGETIRHLNVAFPYWFSPAFHAYNGRAQEYPLDGHLLLSLIAPRPLFVASAKDDPFSDPEGEFQSAKAASAVYSIFGLQGLPSDASFQVGKLTGKDIRYYCRPGKHDMLLEDWLRYIAFADEHFKPSQR